MTTVVKGKILEQDISHWDGVTRTAVRRDGTGGTATGNALGHEVDVLEVYGSGSSYTWQTITDCINRIGSAAVTLVFKPGTWTIDQNLTIGSNFVCRVPAGCVFDVSSGKTLTFSGPVIRDYATWTSGSGTVTESGTRTYSGTHNFVSATVQGIVSRGHIAGLTLSNNASDATNDIDIAVGECTDSTGVYKIKLSSSITKRLDAAWSVGTNQGGLDTGSIANDVYHVWAIARSDTGVSDVLFSASATAPTMPTNYDYKRRVGAFIRSAGAILAFTQLGDEFLLKVPIKDYSSTNPGTTATLRALSVPDGVKVIAKHTVLLVDTTSTVDVYALVTSPDQTDSAPSGNLYNIALISPATTDDVSDSVLFDIRTDTSAQVRTRLSVSDADIGIYGVTHGWLDHRGKAD